MTAREARYSSHPDPIVAEALRDIRDLARSVPVVEYADLTLTTSGSGTIATSHVRLRGMKRPRAVVVGRIEERGAQSAIPTASSVRWDHDPSKGELVVRGIGGLGNSKTYLVTLRVEGE